MTTIIELLEKEFKGKRVKLEKNVYVKHGLEGRKILTCGVVDEIYEDGDKYSGYGIYFRFKDHSEWSIDLTDVIITIVE